MHERCLKSFNIREMQIKGTTRYCYTPIRMVEKKILAIPSGDQEEPSNIAGGMQNDTTTLEHGQAVSQEVKHTLILQPRNHTPEYPPKRNEKLH